ncbi:MAG: PKD domain-containing protein [Bacteroidota bacterium]
MKSYLRLYLIIALLSVSSTTVFASHVVGGILTYVYNGGSSYTITFKLFRDCAAGTAAFDANITITVLGNNGVAFSPSKNITMTLGSVTSVPPVLPPCAIAPPIIPCVQQGIYTTTVTNLPPNFGGYHLYWQRSARNVGVTNCDVDISNCGCLNPNTCNNCVGSGFYAHIPGMSVIWSEDFTLANNTAVDNGPTPWSITPGNPAATANVQNNSLKVTGSSNGKTTWSSQIIPISAYNSVNLSVNLSQTGVLTGTDSILVYYRLNGGPLTLYPTNGFKAGIFTPTVARATGLAGNTLQTVIRVHFATGNATGKAYLFDNVLDSCTVFNNNPAFTLFPPIFLCVGQPFTFDHSATDANGDSLVYSFYTPFNGETGVGPLDPTFPSGNTIAFTPIVWLPGYSANNPLGGTIYLNASTGLLTGTPNTVGKFIVGVKVADYRKGVYISQTLRDFQFTVVNCPSPPPAVAGNDITVNQGCVGQITASGFIPSSVTWKSIYPGALGAYNNYLSCTSGCLTPTASQLAGAPPYIDFEICGASSSCLSTNTCDVVRVTFKPALAVTIAPPNPIICGGQSSITITANGSGGTPPYSYLWNNVNPSQSIIVGNGTYTVKLSDISGCPPAYSTVTVSSYSVAVTANAGTDKTVCKQSPIATLNGTVTAALGGIWSGGGGTFSPNTTTLSGVSYTPSAAELAAGFVDITLTTTGNGICPAASDIVRINYVNFTGTVSITQTPISCFGGNDGKATVNVTGGSSPYTYSWNTSPAQSSVTAINLGLGTYSVIIKNSIGCTTPGSVTFIQPTPIALNSSITNVLCSSGNNGSISITPTGGTGPYTYLWQPGNQTTSSINNQIAGSYTVTVTDSKLCTITSPYTITQPTTMAISFSKSDVSCFNGNNGTATPTISGGTSPYTYNWSQGATSPNATGLQAGSYTLTVTDNLGCSTFNSVLITQPTKVIASTTKNNETCGNLNNGSAAAGAIGGSPGYTYLWQPGALTSTTINNLSSGTYTLTATDIKGCTSTAFAIVTEPAPITINFINKINVSCFAGSNGSVTASPSGGTSGYTYSWVPGGETTASIANLAPGSYSVTVTDINGCFASNAVTITEPSLLTASIISTDETCNYLNNGSSTVTANGGNSGYTYLWKPGLQTSGAVSGLTAASYTVIVTDNTGCSTTATTTINQPVPITINFSQTDPTCFSGTNGSATANPTGGSSGYTYLWSPGGNTTATKTNLTAGTYSVTVTDSKGCNAVNSVLITQPTVILTSITLINESCNQLNNGSATVTSSSGGTPGYTYLWQPGSITTSAISNLASGTYTLATTDFNGCIVTTNAVITEPDPLTIGFTNQINVNCFGENNGSVSAAPAGGTANYTYSWMPGGATTQGISKLLAGTYSVTVTDSEGCFAVNSVTIAQPTLILASTTVTNETCSYLNNGTAIAGAAGGTPGYTYLWKPGLQTTGTISNLSSGTYTVMVSDLKGCTQTASAVISEPPPLTINFTAQTNPNCFAGNTGTVTASPSGGTSGYTYVWAPGGNTNSTIANLTAGTYSVTVTDNSGCSIIKGVEITQPAGFSVSTTQTNETCNNLNNGTANAIPVGGTPGYTYLWQPGAFTTSTISNLSAGNYTLTTTDFNGCETNTIATITEPASLTIGFNNTVNISCFGGNNGSVTAAPSGGTPNYTYSWVPGGATTNGRSNLTAGIYTVTVTDAEMCTATNSITITQPLTPLSVSVSSVPATCYGTATGSLGSSASGGTGPYTYNWMPGNIAGQNVSNIGAGTYTITAVDALGCTAINSVTITQPSQIILTTNSVNSNCNQSDGQASVSVSGGNAPYTYLWSPIGGTNATANGLISGAYTVVVTDFIGCTAVQFGNVNENSAPTASIINVVNVSCYGGSDGSASVTTLGGMAPFTYSWMPSGGTNSTANGLAAGTYTVLVTGNNGCQSLATTSPAITQPTAISTTTSKTKVSCFGGTDGTASIAASGGSPGYTYLWMPGGAAGANQVGLAVNTYTIQVRDNRTCLKTDSIIITGPPTLTAMVSFTPVSCFSGSDGTVTAAATGGTGPYNYSWMPGNSNGPTFSHLTIGTYTVTITDLNGCSYIDSIVVTQPAAIALASSSINSNCSLANGQASVIASGGTGTYSYQWSLSGSTTDMATGLFSGAYTVTVTDANGCTAKDAITVIDNASPIALVSAVTNATCNGANDGTATVSVSGGIGPYTYAWTPSGATDAIASGLAPGTYTVTVKDVNLCTSVPSVSAEITQPNPINIAVTKTNISCFGNTDGTASIIVSGGTSAYTYLWLPGTSTTSSITGLSPNTYTIQVTDSKSCLGTETVNITQPISALSVALTFTPVNCFGGTDGKASAIAAGGTPPYNYSWMPGNINGSDLSNVPSGTYTVSVTDANLCSVTNSITITEPTAIILVSDGINSTCSLANGQASVIASGGTGAYLYQWAPNGGTNSIATGLISGPYSVTVTDANGCVATDGVTVNDDASPVVAVSGVTPVTCNGLNDGTATVNVTGGSAPYTYSWLPSGGTNSTAVGLAPGTYTVIVTDANACQSLPAISNEITQPNPIYIAITKTDISCFGNNNGTASAVVSEGTPGYTYLWMPGAGAGTSITNLIPATYTIQVTDANSCGQAASIIINEPNQLTSVISSTTGASCFGDNNGTATVTMNGGTPVYNYIWSPIGGNGPTGTGFPSGTFTVTVTDFNGCATSSSVTINQPSQALSANNTVSFISCFGADDGTIGIHPSGGTAAYYYQWTPAVSTSDTASALSPGDYTILITDNNSCQTNLSVTVTEPAEINGTLLTVNPSCNLANGSISSLISGGTAPYTYLWQQGSMTTSGINGLGTGTYNLLVTDAFNCTFSLSATLTITPDPTTTVSVSNVSCYGGNNGSATVNIAQGTPPYTLTWLPYGGTTLNANTLAAGTYTVNVTDDLGCQTTGMAIIAEPPPLDVSIDTIINVLCSGGNTGSISLDVSGGSGQSYTYSWAPSGATAADATNLNTGTYTVTVTDQNNCWKAISATTTQPAPLISVINSTGFPLCYGGYGNASVLVSGGILPYSYSWSNSETGSTAYNLGVGSSTVTVTDTNGCSTTNTVVITEPLEVITTSGGNDTLCVGQSGSISATASGGGGNYIYAWQPSGAVTAGTLPITPTSNTTYTVVAYDQNGCPGKPDTLDVIVYTLSASNIQLLGSTPLCPGQSSFLYVETTGTTAETGSLTYQWNNNLGTGTSHLVTPTQPTTYVVTVSNACGLSVSDSIAVLFSPPPTIDLSLVPTIFCAPGILLFDDNSFSGNESDPIFTWYWNFGDGTVSSEENPAHYYQQAGTYLATLTATTINGCTNNNLTAPISITAQPSPTAVFSINSSNLDLPYDELVLNNQSTGANSYIWNFGDGSTSTLFNPHYAYNLIGIFQVQLIAMNQYGCTDTANAEVTTDADVIFPNAFTPNEDGSSGGFYDMNSMDNNVFFPYSSGVVEFKLEIFNRWGELIFQSFDIKQGWDGYYLGELSQEGVYIWKAYVRLNNGKIFSKIGDVTLLKN